jgi:3-isopropylmalate dehydratase small subunit
MEAIKNMPAAIAANFGELHFNNVTKWRALGITSYVYDFAFAPGYANIFYNAAGLIRLTINNKNGYMDVAEDEPVEVLAVVMHHRYRTAGVKFRKLNAKNPAEAVKKIVAWFEKNAEAMKAIEFPGA